MPCDRCRKRDGSSRYPIYDLAPHKHVPDHDAPGGFRTEFLPKPWPSNFVPDPFHPPFGQWWCYHCRENLASAWRIYRRDCAQLNGGLHEGRFSRHQ